MTFRTIIGDVHGNLPALQAVIRAAGSGADSWMCIGDTVGYGPYPNECLSRVKGLDARAVVGNHDLGSLGAITLDRFNINARKACEWTGRTLEDTASDYLGSLPETLADGDLLLVHGSPLDPVWEYVLSTGSARKNFSGFEEGICFHGHSHLPAVFRLGPAAPEPGGLPAIDRVTPAHGEVIELEAGCRYMVNVGSVGQPRDGDPRACYVEHDARLGTLTYRRVDYPVREVQEMMEQVGLPRFLIERLAVGR